MALIELKNISKVFKTGDSQTVALRNVDLEINSGEFIAIVGPSGSGKSTLMHILGLLDSPTEGSYSLNGRSVLRRHDSQLAKLRRSDIGFVFQSFNLLPRLSVIQNVILPMVYAGVPASQRKGRAFELLTKVGVQHRAAYKISQISGGETQRVAVARALANNPSLILADEPTGNLDSKSSQAIIDLLKALNRDGNTVIIVTHNPEIAEQADRVIELRDGEITKARATVPKRRMRELDPESTLHGSGKRTEQRKRQ
ncbi:MAG TPA: ABC transporter ATP-binding protein [Candidatus Saccharimonadales bacterium]|nr:ABC transporter ATP-binding protein [Candidatus Saccharimonadales bacterium]